MKRYSILLILVVLALFARPTSGQQHAMTQEQCKADADAWGPPNNSPFNPFTIDLAQPNPGAFGVASSNAATIDEINSRMLEMEQCKKVDVTFLSGRTYENVELYYLYITWQRMHDFLLRHNLREQFLQEDREGKR
jgi:hypothetical protein